MGDPRCKGAMLGAVVLLAVACTETAPVASVTAAPTPATEASTPSTEPSTPSTEPRVSGTAAVSVANETYTFTVEDCGIGTGVLSVDGTGDAGTLAIRHASPPTREEAQPSMSEFHLTGDVEAHFSGGGIVFNDYVPHERATGTALVDIGVGDDQRDDRVLFAIRCGPSATASDTTVTTAPPSTVPPASSPPADPIVDGLPESRPDSFVAYFDDSVQVVDGRWWTSLDIPAVETGHFWNGWFVYSVTGVDRAWLWPHMWGAEVETPGGTESVQPLFTQVDAAFSTRLYDVADARGVPTVLFSEIDSSTTPTTEHLKSYHLITGGIRTLFDKATRRDGLFAEEQEAPIGDVALGEDRFAALFYFGDGTWLEWYDLDGAPIDDPLPPDVPLPADRTEGAVLEIAMADNLLAIGFETHLHRLTTEVMIVDVTTGGVLSEWSHAVDGESLFDLEFDGRWLSAAILGPDNIQVGTYLADTTTGAVHIIDTPVRLALNRP